MADSTKILRKLNWQPKTKFKDLVKIMVYHDVLLEDCELDMVSVTGGLSK